MAKRSYRSHLTSHIKHPTSNILHLPPILPQFQRIDDVLPQHVASSTNRRNRVQIHIGYPDAQRCILLKQRLSCIYLFAHTATDGTTDTKLYEAKLEGGNRNHQQQYQRGTAMHDILYRDTRRDTQRNSPEIEAQIRLGNYFGTQPLNVMLHQPAQYQGQ